MDKSRFLRGCAEGGRALDEVIAEVHRLHWRDLVREARRVLGAAELACDVAQEALVKCWRACRDFRGEAELWTWLKRIVRNTAIDKLRALHPEVPLSDDAGAVLAEVEQALRDANLDTDAPGDPLAAAMTAEHRRLYESCFARFEADHPLAAVALRWTAEDGLTHEELAQLIGRTPQATREFVSQGRKKARVYLAPWYAAVCYGGRPRAAVAASHRAPAADAPDTSQRSGSRFAA
jgi:RNA polymerase sigma-70 factor (ECF subfamily)